MAEFTLLALDSWLEKVTDEGRRNLLREIILSLPNLGRPTNIYNWGVANWYEYEKDGRKYWVRISVGEDTGE